jgi:hypothetical protein
VSRLLFFLLLVAVAAVGTHIYLTQPAAGPNLAAREVNRDSVKVVAVTPPQVAAREAEETRRAMQSLAGAACVEMSGIAAADLPRARDAFAALHLGERLMERRVEDVTRYWVFVAPAPDRRTADLTIANLRRQGVNDISIRPDNSISLGVFSSEDAARRFLASIEAKGVREAQLGPLVKELREVTMLVREPDTETVARLTIMQRDFGSARLHAVACPAAAATTAANPAAQ